MPPAALLSVIQKGLQFTEAEISVADDGTERMGDPLSLIDAVMPEVIEARRQALTKSLQQEQTANASATFNNATTPTQITTTNTTNPVAATTNPTATTPAVTGVTANTTANTNTGSTKDIKINANELLNSTPAIATTPGSTATPPIKYEVKGQPNSSTSNDTNLLNSNNLNGKSVAKNAHILYIRLFGDTVSFFL